MKIVKSLKVDVNGYKCEFCNSTNIYFHGAIEGYNVDINGGENIKQCYICGKDFCEKHSYTFWDKYVDDTGYEHYNEITTCLKCKPIVEKSYEEEKERDSNAEYEGRLIYLIQERLKEKKHG